MLASPFLLLAAALPAALASNGRVPRSSTVRKYVRSEGGVFRFAADPHPETRIPMFTFFVCAFVYLPTRHTYTAAQADNVYRLDWELFLRVDVHHLLQCLLLFAVFDLLFASRTKARWFVLHLFANALVVVSAWPDVVTTLRDPANAIVGREYSVWPTYFVRLCLPSSCLY